MKKGVRRLLFIFALIAVLVAISITCLIVGRGHTVYLDNKSIEGTNYSSYASVDIIYKGEKIVNLGKAERGAEADEPAGSGAGCHAGRDHRAGNARGGRFRDVPSA